MGCASSKKRTTSIDDLTKADKKKGTEDVSTPSNKNGQVANQGDKDKVVQRREVAQTKTEAPVSTDGTKPIQIPGTHKSFLAPDGIPFIDEDVDSDAENAVVRHDINKNVPKEPVTPQKSTDIPKANVVVEVKPPVVVVAGNSRLVTSPSGHDEQRKQEAAIEVLRQDLNFSAPPSQTIAVTANAGTPTSTTTQLEPSSEQQQKAAVKIQAGIRGYRDRQKVKAIRAELHKSADGPSQLEGAKVEQQHLSVESPHSPEEDAAVKIQANYRGFVARKHVKEMKEHERGSTSPSEHIVNEHSLDLDEENRAATKIQANYKGYKTRKQLGKTK